MMKDVLTVVWKERLALFRQQGRKLQTIFALTIPVVFLGVLFPLQVGRDWVQDPISLFTLVIPMILVAITIPESFAGEREQRTLRTVLASRLPDRALLYGKMVLPVAMGWGCAIAVLIVGLVVANLRVWDGHFLFYPPLIALADFALTLLVAILMAAAGSLISMRSATVQGAQQATVMILMAPALVLQIGLVVLLSVAPGGRDILRETSAVVDFSQPLAVLAWILALATLDVGLLALATKRFKRSRLVLV